MLLPSAISCDTSQPPRLQSALFISPPASPPQLSSQTAIGNLINSCRNLHNLIGSPAPNESTVPGVNTQLPSPPLINMPSPFSRPRLLRRKAGGIATTSHLSRSSLSSLSPPSQADSPRRKRRRTPPRGLNKRRREVDDDMDRDDEESYACQQKESINIFETSGGDARKEDGVFVFRGCTEVSSRAAPSTPKRRRIAPPVMPRGLTREDFHKLGTSGTAEEGTAEDTNVEEDRNGDRWSTEDDQLLVEVVLEKVKNMDLSSEVWDDCVRNLPGKDHNSVSSRWENLLKTDSIGLQDKGKPGRGTPHGAW